MDVNKPFREAYWSLYPFNARAVRRIYFRNIGEKEYHNHGNEIVIDNSKIISPIKYFQNSCMMNVTRPSDSFSNISKAKAEYMKKKKPFDYFYTNCHEKKKILVKSKVKLRNDNWNRQLHQKSDYTRGPLKNYNIIPKILPESCENKIRKYQSFNSIQKSQMHVQQRPQILYRSVQPEQGRMNMSQPQVMEAKMAYENHVSRPVLQYKHREAPSSNWFGGPAVYSSQRVAAPNGIISKNQMK
ncbi:MAG: hypothetical protein MHPSP_000880, partial [Paramarteilia canceri]